MTTNQPTSPIKPKTRNPHTTLDALRDVLKTLENRLAKLNEIPQQEVQEIPALFDQMESLLLQLREKEVNITSELGLVDTLTTRFRKSLGRYLQKAGGAQAIAQARKTRQPSQDYWWWFADELHAANQKSRMVGVLRTAGVLAVAVIVIVFVYQRFLAPDPAFQASYGHQQRAETLMAEGNFETALTEAQAALAYFPENPELLILNGVLYEANGNPELAADYFEAAQLQFASNADVFYIQRAMQYLMLNQLDLAQQDSQTAVTLNTDSANGFLILGQIYEARGQIQDAITHYEYADAAAERIGNAQLQAIARVNMSNAMQRVIIPTPQITTEDED